MVQESENGVKLRIFQSGYCLSDGHVVNPKAGRGKVRFYATWLLIQHPVHGNILFDTGYTDRFHSATRRMPYTLYAWVTPVVIHKEETAIEQLKEIGISAKDIDTIILSHFHADHIGGVKDFPYSQFICSRKSMKEAMEKKGWSAVKKGILPDLLPDDFMTRSKSIEELAQQEIDSESGMVMYDLFKDRTLKIIELPGHARGMLGIRVQHTDGVTVFASDAYWSLDTFQQRILPRQRVKLFFDSWRDYVDSSEKLYKYYRSHPDERLLFTHCPQTLNFITGRPAKID